VGGIGKSGTQYEIIDRVTGLKASIISVAGVNRLASDTTISSVNVPNGRDPVPDTYFAILKAGSIGDQVDIDIAAIVDTSGTERSLPAVSYVYTLVAGDVGKELVLAQNIVDGLNGDSNFQNALLEAFLIEETSGRAVIYISAIPEFASLPGEYGQRATPGDFAVTITSPGADTLIQLDTTHETIISRVKENSLGRDPRNPHLLGIPEFSGQVRLRASAVDKQFFARAEDVGASQELTVDGSVTPVLFDVVADVAGGSTRVIEKMKFIGVDTNIKVQTGQFFGGTALPNGIKIEVFQNGSSFLYPLIKNTAEILGDWPSSASDAKLYNQSGGDLIVSVKDLISNNLQIELEPGTTDRVEITIQDNVNIDDLFFAVEGFLE
jgi:hypothetical protein